MRIYQITESFNTNIDWKLAEENANELIYIASLSDDTYIELTYYSNNDWNTVEASFTRNGSQDITNTGNQMQIFGAVINHIIDFIKRNNIPKLVFSAHKPQGNFGVRDTSRSDLYKKMANRFIKGTGYNLSIRDIGRNDVFTIQNPNIK